MRRTIDSLIQGGYGFCTDRGQAVMVEGALPGEVVETETVMRKRDYRIERVTSIYEASPDRATPFCPHYGECGGCNLQHLKAGVQGKYKAAMVRENLKRIAGLEELDELEVATGPDTGYRMRARFHVSLSEKRVGFRAVGSSSLVQIDHCPVLEPQLASLLEDKKSLLDEARRRMFSGQKCKDGCFEVPVLLSDEGPVMDNKRAFLTVDGIRFALSNRVFFQSNRHLLPALGQFVKENVTGSSVFDLYSGVGTLSAFLPSSYELTLLERNPECKALAGLNCPSAEIYSGDVAKMRLKKSVDTVIVDPPRVGLAKEVPSLIEKLAPRRVLAFSCNPVTLSRDLVRFRECGYKAEKLQVFDMYPHTFHIEAAVLLSPAK